MLLLKNYHHFKKTSITTLNINKKKYMRVEDLILMLRTKRDNRLSNRRISTSLMALGKIWLKK
jgi:hypothetical protein